MSVVVLGTGEGARMSLPNGHDLRYLDMAPDGAFSLLEWTARPGLPGSAIHLHHRTDEGFYVVAGTYGFLIGDERIEASEGGYVFVPHGIVHAFWNAGVADARMLITIAPAGSEGYFRELSDALADGGQDEVRAADVRRALSSRYDIEVVGPPVEPPRP